MYLICPVFYGTIIFGYFGLKYKYFHKGAEPMESFEPKKTGADTNLANLERV